MAEPTPADSAEAAVDAVAELMAAAVALESPAAVESMEGPPELSAGDSAVNPLAGLPAHTHSLLRIGVRVSVTLAAQRKSVQEIIELGPGAIIKFDKTCDEPLELCVGGHPIATGEVVKVGDKFGLRVGRLAKVAVAT